MATIILTALSQVHLHNNKSHPQMQVLTMTMKPQQGIANLDFLAPKKEMVYGHKGYSGWAKISDEEYISQYRAIVEGNMGPIRTWYSTLEQDTLLCCYCTPGKFCHRHYVYRTFEWLNGKGIGGHTLVKDW